MISLFILGGALMWPLALCSAVLAGLIAERAVAVRSSSWKTDVKVRVAHRKFIPFFIDVAPSLGLLGTVLGVMESFRIMDGLGAGQDMGAGLGVACITTVFGLFIALGATFAGFTLDLLGHPGDPK